MRKLTLLPCLLFAASLMAQNGEDVAYVRTRPAPTVSPTPTLGFRETPSPGILALDLPSGTHTVDLINPRGKVKRSLQGAEIDRLDIAKMNSGTWTLRAHTLHGFHVRRFVVMRNGQMVWAAPELPRRRR